MRIDLHTHSNVSDGTDTPAALVDAARGAGLDVVALTDHDTLAGLPEARERARQVGIELLDGIEVSTQWQGTSVHLLGYGVRDDDEALNAELERLRASRAARIDQFAERFTELGLPLTADEIRAQIAPGASVGRPHVADALVAKGMVADRTEAFERYLADGGPGYVERYATELVQAIALIRAAGGVAVLAHPWGRGTESVLTEPVIAELAEQGLDGIEVRHQDHGPVKRLRLAELAGRLGLLATGSSDYHGTGKVNHDLGVNTTQPQVYRQIRERIAERSV